MKRPERTDCSHCAAQQQTSREPSSMLVSSYSKNRLARRSLVTLSHDGLRVTPTILDSGGQDSVNVPLNSLRDRCKCQRPKVPFTRMGCGRCCGQHRRSEAKPLRECRCTIQRPFPLDSPSRKRLHMSI